MPATLSSAQEITERALALNARQRARLAKTLLDSLPPPPGGEITQEEIERRIGEIESGKVRGIPAEKVFSELFAKYRNKK
jgi:putative addiction module component (TIGR02574 family)